MAEPTAMKAGRRVLTSIVNLLVLGTVSLLLLVIKVVNVQ